MQDGQRVRITQACRVPMWRGEEGIVVMAMDDQMRMVELEGGHLICLPESEVEAVEGTTRINDPAQYDAPLL